jgi:hypothetical protein
MSPIQEVQHHIGLLKAVSHTQLDDSLGHRSAVTMVLKVEISRDYHVIYYVYRYFVSLLWIALHTINQSLQTRTFLLV